MQISALLIRFVTVCLSFKLSRLTGFLRSESGATTADWAVGSAAVISMAVGVATESTTATTDLASSTGSYIAQQNVNLKQNDDSGGAGSQDYASNDYGDDGYGDYVSPGGGGSSSSGSTGGTGSTTGGETGSEGEGQQSGGEEQAGEAESAPDGNSEEADNNQTPPADTPSGEGDGEPAESGDGQQETEGDNQANDDENSSGGDGATETADVPLDPSCYRNNGTIKKQCL